MVNESGEEEMIRLAQDTAEGVLSVLQILVISLAKSGHLDTADFSLLLAGWRNDNTDKDSMQQAVVDRVLMMLVDDHEALTRRLEMKLVKGKSHDEPPNPA